MIVDVDSQGFDIKALTLRQILERLGFSKIGKYGFICRSRDLLDSYPMLLEDDGMGYGVKPMFITEADSHVYQDKEFKDITVFNLFRNEYRPVDQRSYPSEEQLNEGSV